MDGKLLARNILCALGTGVIINLSFTATAHASENQNEYTEQPAVVNNGAQSGKQQQLERIRQISQEIADINARLSQLTEELNRYNEQLNNAQVNTNPQIDVDNVESFNENRQLEKTSKIPQENGQDIQNDFTSAKDVVAPEPDIKTGSVQPTSAAMETKESAPLRITSKQIHQNNRSIPQENPAEAAANSADKEKKIEKAEPKERYIAENRDAVINGERRNITFGYDENGFKTNRSAYNSSMVNTAKTVQSVNSKQTQAVINASKTGGNTVANNSINENKNVVIDTERRSVSPSSSGSEFKIDEFSAEPVQETGNKQILTADTKANGTDYSLQQSGRKYISSADILRNRNISKAQQRSGVQIERNEDVMMDDGDRVLDLTKLSMLGRFNSPAPVWTYEYFDKLSVEGLLYPDDDFNLNNLTRREAAILTARSYNLYRIRARHVAADSSAGDNNRFKFASDDINILMKEFAPEVRALGYNIISEVTDTSVNYKTEWDWKYEGEIRYSASKNGGSPRYDWSDSRVYARIFGQKAIADDWTVNALLESEYNFLDDDDSLREKYDGDVELSRIYLQGKKNWWNIPFTIDLGKTYAYLGDGNVLDGDFEGVKISADVTPNANYTIGYGRVNDTETAYYLEALTQNKNYNYLAGIYHWDNYNDPVTIAALGMNYYVDDWTLGGMYLNSSLADGSGAENGYVLTARYKQHFAWVPHSYDFILKYYNMAGNTYINHTMNGVGSYMDGFSGWGAMFNYTLAEDLVLSLEYYDLEDKTTGEKGKTAWAQLSWFFD